MATSTGDGRLVYARIGNIPAEYRSSDLRNYFSQFIETAGFQCFHFRHRVEVQRSISSSEENPNKTMCCVVRLKEDKGAELIKMYHNKHWLSRNGDSIPKRCHIARVKLKEEDTSNEKYQTRKEQKQIPPDRENFTKEDLASLKELHPPYIMPNGNVGTPTKVFLKFISECRLPTGVIKQLGLSFPKTRSKRRYGNVPFDYGGEQIQLDDAEDEEVMSGQGKVIDSTILVNDNEEELQKGSERQSEDEKEDSEDDNDSCEEWERHEALNDDPANIERNKERLFEEEIELKWEKGGSGLVFYTDAQYWDEKEGDFDERTADDWDVDMSVYYEHNGGDKDARDYITMRRDQRRREGMEIDDTPGIGKFERHTKGIGRRVLTKQGWNEGEGLGSTIAGMTDALENDGQNPRSKCGLGYHGEKLKRQYDRKVKHTISTVYDNPCDFELQEPLLRRIHPHSMKYCKQSHKSKDLF